MYIREVSKEGTLISSTPSQRRTTPFRERSAKFLKTMNTRERKKKKEWERKRKGEGRRWWGLCRIGKRCAMVRESSRWRRCVVDRSLAGVEDDSGDEQLQVVQRQNSITMGVTTAKKGGFTAALGTRPLQKSFHWTMVSGADSFFVATDAWIFKLIIWFSICSWNKWFVNDSGGGAKSTLKSLLSE